MNGQADLFIPKTTEDKFWEFHARHPEVYVHLVRLARQAKANGQRKFGMKALFEILRWERHVEGLPDAREAWKLDNRYTAYYARFIMEKETDLDGYFETRKQKAVA